MLNWILTCAFCIFLVEHSSGVTTTTDSQQVNVGDDIVIKCEYPPSDGVSWYYNGINLEATSGVSISNNNGVSTLTRSSATADDSGTYKCMNQEDYFDIDQIVITVSAPGSTGGVRIKTPESLILEVAEAESFTLVCEIDFPGTVEWLFKGMRLAEGVGVIINAHTNTGTGLTSSHLLIESAEESDGGIYRCQNTNDPLDKAEVDVTVLTSNPQDQVDLEIVEPRSETFSLEEGDTLSLKCKGGTYAELGWYHNGFMLRDGPGINLDMSMNGESMLWLRREDIQIREGGQYSCRDANDPFSDHPIVEITVESPGSVNIRQPSPLRAEPGQSFNLECESDSSVNWFKENTPIRDEEDGYILTDARENTKFITYLRKEGATEGDSGKYICRSRVNSMEYDDVVVRVGDAGGVEALPGGPEPSLYENVRLRMQDQMFTLPCASAAVPADQSNGRTDVTWMKNKLTGTLADDNKYIYNRTTLTILNVDKTDIGLYECMVVKQGTGEDPVYDRYNLTAAMCVKPSSLPVNSEFVECPMDTYDGDSCTLECRQGNSTFSVTRECTETGEWDGDFECSGAATLLISAITFLVSISFAKLL